MISRNRENVIFNTFQGTAKRVLCCCSAGCLRSPTAAVVLSSPKFGCNTRAVGLDVNHAIIAVDEGLVIWAQEFVVMSNYQESQLREFIKQVLPDSWEWHLEDKKILVLDIPDEYDYMNPKLVSLIEKTYMELKD